MNIESFQITWQILIWMALGLFALSVNIWGLIDAYIDKEVAKGSEDEGMIQISQRAYGREVLRLLTQASFALAGIFAIFIPVITRPLTFFDIAVPLLLILGQAFIALNVILDRRSRRKIMNANNLMRYNDNVNAN